MCFMARQPAMTPAPAAPARQPQSSSIQNEARVRALKARGVFANIFTSALGDASYGANASKAAALGAVGQ